MAKLNISKYSYEFKPFYSKTRKRRGPKKKVGPLMYSYEWYLLQEKNRISRIGEK